MNFTPRQGGSQSPRQNSHAPMLIVAAIYVVLSIAHLVDFHPAILEALAYLVLAECYRRAYR